MNMTPARDVLVLIECDPSGTPTLPSLCTLSFARELGKITESALVLCWFAPPGTPTSPLLVKLGASLILRCDIEGSMPPLVEACAPALARLARDRNAAYVVGAATSFGKDLLPRVAGTMDSTYVSDCTGLVATSTELRYLRPIYAGNLSVECESRSSTTIVSVRSSEFPPAEALELPPCPVVLVASSVEGQAVQRIASLGFEAMPSTRPALTEAPIVVSGGRALSTRFFDVLGPLADCLGAALGATRAVCDEGLVPSDLQVGQTGKIVAPKLYIAVGISGTVQHIAGMRSSRTIVAINVDPDAPIFTIADYGLVGDLFEVVPALTQAILRIQHEGV